MNEWISVDERLPECEEEVLIYIPFPAPQSYAILFGYLLLGENGYYWTNFDDDADYSGATHWMPLPDPPQEAK